MKIRLGFWVLCAALQVPALAQVAMHLQTGDTAQPPFRIGDANTLQADPGIDVEIITEAANKLGIKLSIERAPTKRILDNLQKNQIDGAFDFSYSSERAAYLRYPMNGNSVDGRKKIHTQTFAVYTIQGSDFSWNGKIFTGTGKTVGSLRGWSVSADLAKLDMRLDEVNVVQQGVSMLLSKRIDAFVGPEETVDYFVAKQHNGHTIVRLPLPFATRDYFVVFTKKYYEQHASTIEKLWEEIGKIRDERINKLLPKYEKYMAP